MKNALTSTGRFANRVVVVVLAWGSVSACGSTIGSSSSSSIGLKAYPSRPVTSAVGTPAASAPATPSGTPTKSAGKSARSTGQPLCEYLGVHEDELRQFPTTAGAAVKVTAAWDLAETKAPAGIRPAFLVLSEAIHAIADGRAPTTDAARIEHESLTVTRWYGAHCVVR